MGVGVPKVPFYCIETEKTTWVDLYDVLSEQRILFVCKKIEGAFVGHIMGLLLYITSEDDTDDVVLYINSNGGWALSGVAIYDIINYVTPDVWTVVMGLAASAASLILVGGTITKRVAYPHARVMLHQPSTTRFEGDIKTIVLEGEELFKVRKMIAEIYSQNTGRPLSVIYKDMERDTYMSATEAKSYGIIDRVIGEIQENTE